MYILEFVFFLSTYRARFLLLLQRPYHLHFKSCVFLVIILKSITSLNKVRIPTNIIMQTILSVNWDFAHADHRSSV